MKCARCGDGRYPLARIRYRLDGKTRCTAPLCFDCRGAARRLVWRQGGRPLDTTSAVDRAG
jgi:hypothetical protein